MATRNEIESQADLAQLFDLSESDLKKLQERPAGASQAAAQLVDLNSSVSPAVLAGILGTNVSMIYQYRQDGKLPPNSDASIRDCIKHHLTWYRNKASSKASNMSEAALEQSIQLTRAKTEQTWLAIKKERGDLVDVKVLAETFESTFLHLRSQLLSLARRHPDTQKDIDAMLAGWEEAGRTMLKKADEEFDNFIQIQMEAEVQLPKSEELSEEEVA